MAVGPLGWSGNRFASIRAASKVVKHRVSPTGLELVEHAYVMRSTNERDSVKVAVAGLHQLWAAWGLPVGPSHVVEYSQMARGRNLEKRAVVVGATLRAATVKVAISTQSRIAAFNALRTRDRMQRFESSSGRDLVENAHAP